MATALPFSTMPFPLGAVQPPSAGTPLRLCNNFTDLNTQPVYRIRVQALAGNTNPVYILSEYVAAGGSPTGKNTTNYVNIVAVLTAGQSQDFTGEYGNSLVLGNFWVDPTTNGEGVFSMILDN